MRSPITVSLILSTLMLVSIIPYDVPTVLEDIDEVMFANSEPQMLVKAGTYTISYAQSCFGGSGVCIIN